MPVKKKLLGGILFYLAALAAIFLVTGCGRGAVPPSTLQPLQEEKDKTTEEVLPPAEKVVLFFTSNATDKLAREEREIVVAGKDLKIAILEELIKGPQNPDLGSTVPPDVKVLGVKVDEKGLARVDFSREILTSHWGGSMGEIMTVYSVVNTLALLPDVEQVRFLVEGEEVETLIGHLDISEPVEPDWDLVEK